MKKEDIPVKMPEPMVVDGLPFQLALLGPRGQLVTLNNGKVEEHQIPQDVMNKAWEDAMEELHQGFKVPREYIYPSTKEEK